jgi:UDP-N-acetyl-D-mannosaminuronate dehydrogenase
MISVRNCRFGVIGLGYVGLPPAVEFGQRFDTAGLSPERINPTEEPHRLANIRKVTAGSDGRR